MDRMDDIWKDRFNSEELPAENWNSPDDLVWEAVAAQTVRKDKKRLLVWWILGLLALTISIFAAYMFKNANATALNAAEKEVPTLVVANSSNSIPNNTLTPTKEESTTSNDVFKSEINISKEKQLTTTTNKNTNPTNLSTNTSQVNNSITKTPINTITNNPNNTAPKVAKAVVNTKTQNNTAKKATNPNSLATFSKTELDTRQEQIAPDAPTESSVIAPSDFNTSIMLLESANVLLENNTINEGDRAVQKLKDKKSIFFSLNAGATYWQHNISEQYTSDLSDFDFNYTDELGFLLDMDLDIPLGKRFMLQVGMDYEQVNISSGHNSELSYDPSQEGSQPHNDYALSLATPYGLSAAEFSFVRAESVGEEPVALTVDFHSAHTIQNFSVPVSFLFAPFGNTNRFSPYLKAGFGVNYLRKLSNDIESIDTHHSAIQFDDSGTSNFQSADIERWHYDYRLGIGAAYRLSPRLSLRLHYEYARGINAIFQQDNYNTRINRHHISLGLSRSISNFP
ncbi:MAG: outer membrane protein [Saprospiraceae bacterium]